MWSDNETTEDLLGFQVHADLIKEVVLDKTLMPITVGVFGDWGSGKSSIMKIVQSDLEKQEGVVCIYFNGWLLEGYDDAKAALMEAILIHLSKHKVYGEKIKGKTENLLRSINWMRLASTGLKNVLIPVASAYLTGGASIIPSLVSKFEKFKDNPDQLISKLKSEGTENFVKGLVKEKEPQEEMLTAIREFRSNFAQLLSETEIESLVILIDDLDRCSVERIIDNLEAIKLFLNVENTAFIIGADKRIISHAIHHRYKEADNNKKLVKDYLEKLIQVPYQLPRLSDSEVETYITLLFCKRYLNHEDFKKVLNSFYELRKKDKYSVFSISNVRQLENLNNLEDLEKNMSLIPSLAPLITEVLEGNPRQIKRYLNTFMIRKKLAEVANLEDFRNDVLAKLMVLEYSDEPRFKELYNWQSIQEGKPKQLLEIEKIVEKRKDITEKLEKYPGWNSNEVIKWINVDPKLSTIDLRDYYWITRDKITSSMVGSSLVPPYVRALFNKLIKAPSQTVIKEIITKEVKALQSNELKLLQVMIQNNLKKEPARRQTYDVFNLLIEENVQDSLSYYKTAISNISHKAIPPAIGIILLRLVKKNPDFQGIIDLLIDSDSLVSRTLNKK